MFPSCQKTGEELFGGAGSNQAVTLGSVDQQGNDAVNDLTYVMLRATELLRLRDPNVNCRYHPEVNPPEYLRRLCEVNVDTGATPCFHNDSSTIEALTGQGVTLEHARDYSSVGCVEPVSSGRTYGHTGAILMNLTSALEMALFQGKHRLTEDEQFGPLTPAPEMMGSFEEFRKVFETQSSWLVDQAVTLNNNLGIAHQLIHPTPLLSVLMEGSMVSGKDVIEGGALYNSSGVAIIGMAEVIDSLNAIQELDFDRKTVSFAEMIEAIKRNWNDPYRKLHQMAKNSKEKFGTDSKKAKENADYLIDFLHRTFQSKQHYRGGKYTVGYWTMTYHAGFALLTGALHSGRVKGEPLPSGITPVSGSAPELTPCLNFVGIPYTERQSQAPMPEKFTAFTFTDQPNGNCNDHILAEINEDIESKQTIIDLLKFYSDALREHPDVDSPYFVKLHELFNRGSGLQKIRGYLRGALVSVCSEGLLNIFDLNTLNMAWGLARLFTPWTGKTFEDIDLERLKDLTDSNETGDLPTFWGSNTSSLRSTRKRIVGQAMQVAGIWTKEASGEEKRVLGFDLKSFFFIGRQGVSVNEDNLGKQVFQLNYRWPKLRTFPPDNYCIDEVVQIQDMRYNEKS